MSELNKAYTMIDILQQQLKAEQKELENMHVRALRAEQEVGRLYCELDKAMSKN